VGVLRVVAAVARQGNIQPFGIGDVASFGEGLRSRLAKVWL
jgi:hypothetical protein